MSKIPEVNADLWKRVK